MRSLRTLRTLAVGNCAQQAFRALYPVLFPKFWPAVAVALLFGAAKCSNLAPELVTNGSNCPTGSCYADDAGAVANDSSTDAVVPDSSKDAPAVPVNPLCGSGCMPNNGAQACGVPEGGTSGLNDSGVGTFDAGADDAASSTADGSEGDAGDIAAPDAGLTDANGVDKDAGDSKGPDGSTPGNMGSSAGKQNAPSPEPTPDGTQQLACQVMPTQSGPKAECVSAGIGQAGDACETATDCAAGLACVGNQAAGVCRAYCCLSAEGCAKGTYCAERQSKTGSSAEITLPVCVPAEQCELLRSDACPKDLACSIVRADGTTACITPGAAKTGETCPCAAGYVCTQATNTCLKLCHTNASADDSECGDGVCQGGTTGIPDGFGVCVAAKSSK